MREASEIRVTGIGRGRCAGDARSAEKIQAELERDLYPRREPSSSVKDWKTQE